MYVRNYRFRDVHSYAGSGVNQYGPYQVNMAIPHLVEGIYSWRTGRNAVSDPPVSPRVKRVSEDGFGIKTPTNRGNLAERLASRKAYLEEFQRAAFPAETQTGSVSTDRTSTTDSGHLFASMKVWRQPYHSYLNIINPTSGRGYIGDAFAGSERNGFLNPSGYTFGLTTNNVGLLSVTSVNRQGLANRYFANTAPDRNVGSLGVTLAELLRGDIPSVLKNFREMMAGLKSIRNMVGSDTLNIMFGWTPIIQEYANLIKVGMALERVVYYESFRRKRQWDGPSARVETVMPVSIGSGGTPYNSAYLHLQPEGLVQGPSNGTGITYETQSITVEVEDYHFASKYTGLAKAGRRAESYSDQAMDVVKRLGLVDDPQMLWDLTPYSWLVDWFTTMGDSISNAHVYSPIKGKYNVDYAYLSSQRLQKVDGCLLKRQSAPLLPGQTEEIRNAKSFVYTRTRWRDRATPFGFGTQLGSLSASQYAILVALGLARSR